MAVAIPLAIAGYNIISGIVSKNKAKKEAAKLSATRPKFAPSQYDKDTLSLSESELSTGQSGKAQQAYEEGSDKDFSTSLSGILSMGGDVNDINKLFGEKQAGRQRYTMLTDQLRLGQIDRVVQARQRMEQGRQEEFEFNKWRPWADSAQATAAAREQSQKQISEGINTAGSAASSYLQGEQEKSDYNKYFAPPLDNPNSSNPSSVQPVTPSSYTPNVAGSAGPAPTTPMELNYNWDYHNTPNSLPSGDFQWPSGYKLDMKGYSNQDDQ